MQFSAEFRPYAAERWDALASSGDLLVRGHLHPSNDTPNRGLVIEAIEVRVLGWTRDYLDQVLVEHGWQRPDETPWVTCDDASLTTAILPLPGDAPQQLELHIEVPMASQAGARWVVQQWLHSTSAPPEITRFSL